MPAILGVKTVGVAISACTDLAIYLILKSPLIG